MAANARQLLGQTGERYAAEHYERLGYTVLERNYRVLAGEIDLIVCDRRTLVFVEVKTRRAGGLDPLGAITQDKQRRLRLLAVSWLASHPQRPRRGELRIDAVAVVIDGAGRLVALDQVEDVA
jgi:putative endonuclease